MALLCTGSTASRNYVPGMTEAFYRKLPVLAITATQHPGRVGNNYGQVLDRSQPMKDIVKESVFVGRVYSAEDEWACGMTINKALIALRREGGGPAHINLETTYSRDFSVKELPPVKGIRYTFGIKDMPEIADGTRVAVMLGVHPKWSDALARAVEDFCAAYDAVVLNHHACNYKGEYGASYAVMLNMQQYVSPNLDADLIIYIGSVARYVSGVRNKNCVMWRVAPDGIIRDNERKLTHLFQADEVDFFRYYADLKKGKTKPCRFAKALQAEYEEVIAKVPELPFSNVYVAQHAIQKLPEGCVLHLAGSNTARAWNFFTLSKSIVCHANDGTMGIDGQLSALLGESLATPDKLHFGAIGDLTFFYDMNSIGNRHIGNNVRLIVVNNGRGAEFKLYSHPAFQWGDDANAFMAAAGHYGNQSPDLIRHYAEDLGYEYLTASTKEEFLEKLERFTTPTMTDKSMIFEIFTNSDDENEAIYTMNHLVQTADGKAKDVAKNMLKSLGGESAVKKVKSWLKH